jgi:hypothetical protein
MRGNQPPFFDPAVQPRGAAIKVLETISNTVAVTAQGWATKLVGGRSP